MAAFKLILITLFFVSMVMVVPSAYGFGEEICQTDADCMRTYAGYCLSNNPQAYCEKNVCHCIRNEVRCDTNEDCAGRIPCRTGGKTPGCLLNICFCVKRPPFY